MVIRDVWHALNITGKNIFWGFILVFLLMISLKDIVISEALDSAFNILMTILLMQSFIIYRANLKYEINTEKNSFIFPRSDIENNIFQILIGAKYWNLMRRKKIKLSDIENIYLDTKRWQTNKNKHVGYYKDGKSRYRTETKKHVRFRINVTGSFGSANLSFLDRQKRDEVRSALQVAVRKSTGKNIDRKVSEFS